METWDAIASRRSVRTYLDQPIPENDLNRILEAGRRAPSSVNEQRWDFVVVTDRDRLRQLAKVWRGGSHIAVSAATIALGQLIIEVRVAPTTPAEFIVFQIIQEPGRKIIDE